MFSLARISAVARKEFRHLKRDRLTGGMVVGIPIFMTLLFGYAINNDVKHLPAAVVDHANTSASRALIADTQASQVIDIVKPASSKTDLEYMLGSGEISVGLYIPPDFERRKVRTGKALGQLLIDGSDPIIFSAARALSQLPLEKVNIPPPETVFAIRALYNPERRSSVFILPGLCGVILTLTMVLFTSIAIVRERERGNMELLITTPIGVLELMIGKILPYILIGYIQITIILTIGILLFRIPIRGDLTDFYIGAGFFISSTLTLGLVISTLAVSQFQAFQMSFMTFLPQLLLSGYMFPFEGMPRAAQWIAEVFPLTHFIRIARGVILRAADLPQLWSQIWPLIIFFLVSISFATFRFRKRLD